MSISVESIFQAINVLVLLHSQSDYQSKCHGRVSILSYTQWFRMAPYSACDVEPNDFEMDSEGMVERALEGQPKQCPRITLEQ